ncbi:MAG TPA: hypothetical protein PK605_00440 [Ignavibacteria bacterium]|nr:hypothetical protein [Bacteroidota bacterium]HRE10752.1 hypothetical protein [Ignavibacteria bacterium]HRF66007.1 hypothetical protein [Ignavibacteria bacterium]HRJ02847.1 hypothetical protein [Ignavibacteria bacterium]HRJ84405.1 hypothetical protein [Ignavibacteria bacterium]
MPTKSQKRVRKTGANEVWYKLPSGSWTCVGLINQGYVAPVDETTYDKVPLAGAKTVTIGGTREVGFEGQLAQSGKDELDLIDLLNNKTGELYVFDGTVATDYLEFYFKEVEFQVTSRKTEGQLQVIDFKCNAVEQDAAVSIADTGLPTVKKAAAGTYTGNKYYAKIQTAVA